MTQSHAEFSKKRSNVKRRGEEKREEESPVATWIHEFPRDEIFEFLHDVVGELWDVLELEGVPAHLRVHYWQYGIGVR